MSKPRPPTLLYKKEYSNKNILTVNEHITFSSEHNVSEYSNLYFFFNFEHGGISGTRSIQFWIRGFEYDEFPIIGNPNLEDLYMFINPIYDTTSTAIDVNSPDNDHILLTDSFGDTTNYCFGFEDIIVPRVINIETDGTSGAGDQINSLIIATKEY